MMKTCANRECGFYRSYNRLLLCSKTTHHMMIFCMVVQIMTMVRVMTLFLWGDPLGFGLRIGMGWC